MKNPWPKRNKEAVEQGFRSGLEKATYDNLISRGVAVSYEDREVKFTPPAKRRTYHPDFTLPNGILIETKGRFITKDRQKHLAIQAEYPELDIRFVFSNVNGRISATSKTTYAMWCTKYGFKYADKVVPAEWLDEYKLYPLLTAARLDALDKYTIKTAEKDKGVL